MLSGSANAVAPAGWANDDGPLPDAGERDRLQAALQTWEIVAGADGDDIARMWFIGINSFLGETPPVSALRAGRLDEVRRAARAHADDTRSY